jgi:hypothetical protein
MTKQSLQLSTLTLAGSLTTLLRTQFSSAIEPRNLFLLVADIYRRISLLLIKIQTYITNDKRPLKIDKKTLTGQNSTTANTRLAQWGLTWFIETFCFYYKFVLVDNLVFQNPPLRLHANRWLQLNQSEI